jgi:hypothetical protein
MHYKSLSMASKIIHGQWVDNSQLTHLNPYRLEHYSTLIHFSNC